MEFMRAMAAAEEIERFRLEEADVLVTKDSEAWDAIGVPALANGSSPRLDLSMRLRIGRLADPRWHHSRRKWQL